MTAPRYVLNLRCADTKGIVAAVAGLLAASDASIVEANQFQDPVSNQFFQRIVFSPFGSQFPGLEDFRARFDAVAQQFGMTWSLTDLSRRPRVLIAVSKFGHCLHDLIHRWKAGTLAADIAGVVSNHEDLRAFVEWNGIAYHYLPITASTKAAQEKQFLDVIAREAVDLLVLARYMQILSPEFSAAVAGRCINIHHSFLPGFKGARPYHQAHERGVKIIGATAHYVTSRLDEGPIIEQAVERVDHGHAPEDLMEVGRDIECAVLARAVRWHIERRVMLNGQRTIVFR